LKRGLVDSKAAERRHSLVGPAHLWAMKRSFQIQFLKNVGLEPEHYLADLGCGTLRGGIPIIEYLAEGHYCGIEVRAEVLEEGRKELREAGLEGKRPLLIGADKLSALELDGRFDFIWAFSVLIHMSDEVLDGCLGFVRRHLRPRGSFYANVAIGDRPETHQWREFPLVCRTREFYEAATRGQGLHFRDIGPLSSLGHVSGNPGDAHRMLRFRLGADTARRSGVAQQEDAADGVVDPR
jgi:SAM-dependent methyltransferase